MTTEQLEDFEQLGRRAVACKHWRWMPGMLTTYATRVNSVTRNGSPEPRLGGLIEADPLPALDDPATMGCLLALVREAHHAPAAYLMGSVSQQWVVHHFAEPEAYWKPLTKWQPTEVEALVAALEAAP